MGHFIEESVVQLLRKGVIFFMGQSPKKFQDAEPGQTLAAHRNDFTECLIALILQGVFQGLVMMAVPTEGSGHFGDIGLYRIPGVDNICGISQQPVNGRVAFKQSRDVGFLKQAVPPFKSDDTRTLLYFR